MRRRISGEWWIVISFLGLILVSTLLLLLPSSHSSRPISFIDALFTATSAACVTGLVTLETGSFFSTFGQIVILCTFQLGGLGIITVSSFFAILLGKRMPMRQRDIVRRTHSSLDPQFFLRLVKRIAVFSLTIELAGALLLFLSWREHFGLLGAAWQSLFHSVSAFCNAGFTLLPGSLSSFSGEPATNLIVMALIIVGGLGFFVVYDLERLFLLRRRISLHSKLVLITSGVLLTTGALGFFWMESGNVLQGRGLVERILISLFQSTTSRTAGFNTIDVGQLTNSSLLLLMFLMFIGGSPGSTSGGIKTTTLAVLLANAMNRISGRRSTNLFRRTLPRKVVNQAITIALLSLLLLIVFNFTLQWSEIGLVPHRQVAGDLLDLSFEAVSAFGTVGLSMGKTAELSNWGKVQIILLMFIGRIGPLVIAVAISRRQRTGQDYEFYRENVMVG